MKKLICTIGRKNGEEVEYTDAVAKRLLADGRAITPQERLKRAKDAESRAKAAEKAKGKNK